MEIIIAYRLHGKEATRRTPLHNLPQNFTLAQFSALKISGRLAVCLQQQLDKGFGLVENLESEAGNRYKIFHEAIKNMPVYVPGWNCYFSAVTVLATAWGAVLLFRQDQLTFSS